VLALIGLTAEEALALRPADFDARLLRVNVAGAWARQLVLPTWMPQLMPEGMASDGPVPQDASGHAVDSADVASMVISASLDAQLPQAAHIGWEVLRDTAIDWLVGQGLRYSELPRVVGRVDAQKLQALSSRHAEMLRQEFANVDPLMPALRLDLHA
jgi:hypothetical protein